MLRFFGSGSRVVQIDRSILTDAASKIVNGKLIAPFRVTFWPSWHRMVNLDERLTVEMPDKTAFTTITPRHHLELRERVARQEARIEALKLQMKQMQHGYMRKIRRLERKLNALQGASGN